eukprot:2290313-Amphidinium_carterae.1
MDIRVSFHSAAFAAEHSSTKCANVGSGAMLKEERCPRWAQPVTRTLNQGSAMQRTECAPCSKSAS